LLAHVKSAAGQLQHSAVTPNHPDHQTRSLGSRPGC
jgi:hypothetical protein